MPKLAYDKHYGALAMFPFPFGWLSVMALPLLGFSKNKRWLRKTNSIFMHIVYFPVMLCVLLLFVTVNLLLIPVAYFKTLVHKIALLKRFRSTS